MYGLFLTFDPKAFLSSLYVREKTKEKEKKKEKKKTVLSLLSLLLP